MTSGYTLIEMLIVIALIALVATLTIPRLIQRDPDPGAFATALSSYLNGAASYAAGHEAKVCISKQEEVLKAIPWTETIRIPSGITVSIVPFCYDPKGMVDWTQTIVVRSTDGRMNWIQIDPKYGNARPQ